MTKLSHEYKVSLFSAGTTTAKKSFGWNNIAFFSVLASVGVSLISNVLNISNSLKRKPTPVQTTKIFGTSNILKTVFF